MLPKSVRIFVCAIRQDMRRSFDSLALVTQQVLGEDPQNGSLFVFFGKRPTRVKILWWDKNGYCLLYKRLHRALFRIPEAPADAPAIQIDAAGFAELIAGVQTQIKHPVRRFDA